jgi:methyl-accepting chemotaxis protein
MVKLMYDMTTQVTLMTEHVASLARDVAEMRRHVGVMAEHMGRMDQTIHEGSESMQRWNPLQMMVPGGQGGR